MSEIVSGILGQLGPSGVAQIAKTLGTDEGPTQGALAAAIPAILAGMANNTRKSDGAASLSAALDDHQPSIFDQLGPLLGGSGVDGSKILGHVLGQRQPSTEQNLAKKSGLSLDVIMKLLPIVAPLVMGYLAKQKQEKNLDASALDQVLRSETEATEEKAPGLLNSLLDSDGDGSIVDDIIGKFLK